jgi:hypothetical protein
LSDVSWKSVVIAVAFPKVVSLQPKSASTFYGRHGNNDQNADTHPEDITQKNQAGTL